MNFRDLYQKIRELDTKTDEACGDPHMDAPMPTMEKPETPEPTMNVSMNAQGMDNIEGIMKLFQKVNPDMSVGDKPDMPVNPMSGIDAPMIKLPIEKDGVDNEEPDMDGDNDDMPGGEKDEK